MGLRGGRNEVTNWSYELSCGHHQASETAPPRPIGSWAHCFGCGNRSSVVDRKPLTRIEWKLIKKEYREGTFNG